MSLGVTEGATFARRDGVARAVPPLLEVDGVHTFYGETQVLFDVSFEVGVGEVFALLGPNGAGKTTTLRSILALTRPKRGRIRFGGVDVTHWPTHRLARSGIGWVPDDRRLCPTLTVAKNLSIAQKRTNFRPWSIKETCELFSPLEHLMHRDAENLSGGEMQMVAISRALLGSPGLVLFDEPSQGLAPKIVEDVLATIRRLKSEGIASIVVEQNAEIALSVADRAAVLDRGRIAWAGPAAELREDRALRRMLLGT
jgi:branched-chain amino acid transport system ATP-binding protein